MAKSEKAAGERRCQRPGIPTIRHTSPAAPVGCYGDRLLPKDGAKTFGTGHVRLDLKRASPLPGDMLTTGPGRNDVGTSRPGGGYRGCTGCRARPL